MMKKHDSCYFFLRWQ